MIRDVLPRARSDSLIVLGESRTAECLHRRGFVAREVMGFMHISSDHYARLRRAMLEPDVVLVSRIEGGRRRVVGLVPGESGREERGVGHGEDEEDVAGHVPDRG